MPTSSTTRKKPTDRKSKVSVEKKQISSAKQWKKKRDEEVELPSGNVCLARRPGPELFLAQGLLPDSLSPIIQEAIRSGKGLPPEKTRELISDEESVVKMLDAVDKIVAQIVVQPEVEYHKNPDGSTISDPDRDEDLVYTDEIDLDDKMFLFNFAVGGTRDLERFRQEYDASLGDVQSG